MASNESGDKGRKDDKSSKGDRSSEKDKSSVGDALKKVLSVGVTAAFMTEESIRTYLGDIKLPKEVLGALLQSASKGKDELTQRVTKEVTGLISKIDWAKEVAKFAETHKFRISAEIDIIKKNSDSKDS